MNLFLDDLLRRFVSATLGTATASWLWPSHFRRMASTQPGAEAHHAEEVADDKEHVGSGSQGQPQNGPASCEPGKKKEAGVTAAKPEPPRTAEVDAVSRLPGLTVFCQQVEARIAAWKQGSPTFAVALIEVDQFQQDGGGRTRQLVTRAATSFLTATIREPDSVGQYRPGCFGLLLGMAELADAIRVAERLRKEFLAYSHSTEGVQSKLTLSIGVAELPKRTIPACFSDEPRRPWMPQIAKEAIEPITTMVSVVAPRLGGAFNTDLSAFSRARLHFLRNSLYSCLIL